MKSMSPVYPFQQVWARPFFTGIGFSVRMNYITHACLSLGNIKAVGEDNLESRPP